MRILYSDEILIEEVAVGNERAFKQLFDQYWRRIHGIALKLSKSPDIAEEMVQDIFLKIWLKRASLLDINSFEAYLVTVARNHILNELRKKVKEEPFTQHLLSYLKDSSSNPEQNIIKKETEQLVDAAVDTLPSQQKAVFKLSREGLLTHKEISEKLQISANTVKVHMNKALKGIRLYLSRYSDEILLLILSTKIFF
ncbi:MAG TPA: RNA polymerase sigma-70 factor [Pedobacter sp.]|jgi:RNA polymerase sigma-70 factor (ECF subfamily)